MRKEWDIYLIVGIPAIMLGLVGLSDHPNKPALIGMALAVGLLLFIGIKLGRLAAHVWRRRP